MTKKKDEDKDIIFPKFDEKEYIQKETLNTKVTLITLGYAIVVAFCSFGLSRISPLLVPVGFLLGIFAIMNLRMLYEKLKIDTSKFEKGNWIGNGMMTFFCWLAVWILLSNPPITDMASPSISHMNIYKVDNATVENGWLVPEEDKSIEFSTYGENYVKPGDILLLKVDIVDNYKLEKSSLIVEITTPLGENKEHIVLEKTSSNIRALFKTHVAKKENSSEPKLPFKLKDENYFMAYEFPKGNEAKGEYKFKISAEDSHGNKNSVTKTILVD